MKRNTSAEKNTRDEKYKITEGKIQDKNTAAK